MIHAMQVPFPSYFVSQSFFLSLIFVSLLCCHLVFICASCDDDLPLEKDVDTYIACHLLCVSHPL